MAMVLAIQHWRPYLLGRKFIVSTDQKSLKQLMQQRIVTMEQQNWAAKLLGYDFDIVYKQGKLNKGADALSRIKHKLVSMFTSAAIPISITDVTKSYTEDDKCKELIAH
jgi:hypothetical protein